MNRLPMTVAALSAALMPLLLDSTLKGAALLAVAALCALALFRASAATRHLVWLVAVAALLVVPVLSVLLPQWRVLPSWTAVLQGTEWTERTEGTETSQGKAGPALPEPAPAPLTSPESSPGHPQPPGTLPTAFPVPSVPSVPSVPLVPSTHPLLPLAWLAGCALLSLRLLAAHMLLRRAARGCRVLTGGAPLAAAFEAVRTEMGVSQRVTLLLDERRTIPVVWGIVRPRLLLPAEARTWGTEQLRSVFLHELAHLKRRDPLVQWLTQIACALHWWNPLVWLAAWRVHVERERACDDLVLASGVRPSAYAEHLLDVATKLSPARWTSACGLAMARKSSLEGRLLAVLSEKLNRRGVTSALAAIALLLGAGIAIPVAMLRAADEKWNPPQAAHIGTNDFSVYCIHDGKDAAFVIAYHGETGSSSAHDSNSRTRTWTDSGTLTAKKPGIALSFLRTHAAPGKVSITTAPAEGRDLFKPAPAPRDFGQKEYDLTNGRVFLLSDSGAVRQFDLPAPVVTDQPSAKILAELLAAVPPQERDDAAPPRDTVGQLAPETVAKLKWGEPVNGLRMALAWPPALNDALLGKKPVFELVVQNVAENEVHFLASDDAPNPRKMLIRENERIVQALSDPEVSSADWKLQPGQCGVLPLYTKEAAGKDGVIPSSAIESDLSKIGRYHAIVNMEIANAPAGAWTGKLVTGQTRGSADKADAPAPKHKDARALFEIWQRHARANGDIPGALVGELAAAVRTFINYNPTWETVPKLNDILPRLDATRDWKPADAIALLDEIASVQDSPVMAAAERASRHTIREGEALPEKFAGLAWGETQPNGLRAAWVLEPDAAEHRIGAALKARLLVQNAGNVPVMARVPTWHQGWVKASDAEGAEVEVSGISWTTLAQLFPVRLGPGETIEINTPGVGLGPRAGMGPWAGPRVGSNVLANPGDELTLTHGAVPLDGSDVGVREDDPHLIGPGWWETHIKARLARDLPLPADAVERARLLDRAVRELFATAPTVEETVAFTADQTPGAFDALVQRLAARADVVEFSGKLEAAPVKFRVLDAAPDADKMPRVVLGPGEYPLSGATARSGAVTLKIVGRPVDDRRTNDAQLLFEPAEATGKLPPDPHKLEIPDGWGTWAIVCRPGEGFFYLLHQGGVRKIDYTNPPKVTDTPATDLPAEFRNEVKRQFDIHEVSAESQAEIFEKPAPPASESGDTGQRRKVDWSRFTSSDLKTPFDPEEALRLAASPAKSEDDYRQLMYQVLKGAAEKAPELRPLLELDRDENPGFVPVLSAYDYSINGNKAALRSILDELAAELEGEDTWAALALGFIDEWELSIDAFEKHYSGNNDGSRGECVSLFWDKRKHLFPESYARFQARQTSGANAEPKSAEIPAKMEDNIVKVPDDQYVKSGLPVTEVEGLVWNDPQNGLSLGYRIIGDEWRILGKQVKVELWVRNPGDKDVKFQLNMRPDMGLRLKLKNEKGEEIKAAIVPNDRPPFGMLHLLPPGHALKVKEFPISLFRPINDVSSVRDHFFPIEPGAYTFHCELELPGFTATGEGGKQLTPAADEWTGKLMTRELNVSVVAPDAPAPKPEGAKIPNPPDSAYAKSGIPLGELGKSIAWSGAESKGMRLGIHIPDDAVWRIVGEVKAEVWAHNAGETDVKFSRSPRTDVGLSIIATGADGKKHFADITQFRGYPILTHMLLPAGNVVKLKEFTMKLGKKKDGERVNLDLPPGDYKLSAVWSDTTSRAVPEGEWSGKLTTGEIEFKIAAANADSEPKTSAAAQPITDGQSSAVVLRADGQEPVVILTGRALTASPDSTSREGSVTMEVATSDKTETIRYTWPEDAPGFLDLELSGRGFFRYDLSRGRVFFVHFEELEFSADVFQVPAAVAVPAITSPETLTQAATAVTAWHAASDDRALWESSRVVVPDSEYKIGQPLDDAADKIVWGEANEVGLRLGVGGLEPGAAFPVGQQLPVVQYIRNDGTEAITFSPTQIFNEGVGGELVRKADGKKFPHQKGYPWQGFFDRVRLAPGHYIALGSGPMRTIMAEKDGSSPGGMDMMAHGFTVLPGEYTLQLTHGIGQFLGRPANFHFGDPRGAPGLGEWTGVLTSAAVPLRLADEQVKTAKAGDSEAFGTRYMIAFDNGVLRLRHYNGYPNMSRTGGPWEDQSRDWKVPAADGDYVAAWAVGGKGLWIKDASGITHLIVKENLTETGRWTLDQVHGALGGMPAGVRAALQLPPPAVSQPFDFKKLPATPGAAKIEGGFFEMTIAPDTVLKVPHGRREFFIESGGSVYGPAEGNPVVELGLTELLRAKLAETPNTVGLEMLRHMIADGRGTIRDLAFRLLADLKAPQAPFDYDAVFHAMIHASIEDEDGPKELTPEARRSYTWFHNLFHSTRLEWERTRPLLEAGRYQPGETPGADPAIVWTPGSDGMSVGVSGLPADTNLEIGKSVPVAVYLRNDSPAPVKLSVPAEHNPVVQISLTDAAGKTHRAHYSFSAPLTGYRHHELAPGTGAKVAAFDLEACATPEEADRAEHQEGKAHNPRLAVPAGSYELHLEYRNYQENPVPKGAASEWTGKVTAKPLPMKVAAAALQQQSAPEAPKPAAQAIPRHESAQSLFRKWQASARTDGKIPGALIGHVAREVENFLRQYPDDEKTPLLAALLPRLDAARDWTPEEAVALLDDITAISTTPVGWADIPMEFSSMRAVKGGQPLPVELESAAWGEPAANGLRAAWLLEPRAEQYALGTVLKARVLFHNPGIAPVFFQTEAMHQNGDHTARDAKGAAIKLSMLWLSGETPSASFRLAPGEYCEVMGGGIAIGSRATYEKEFSIGSYFTAIEAREGDEVSFSSTVEAINGGWSRPGDPKDPTELWKKTIAERVANAAPMPANAADREQLIRRVTLDLLGVEPTAEEIAAFTADDEPHALAKLTARLQAHPRIELYSGKLPTGETKFRVIAADPDAAKAPHAANSPGRYVLGDHAHLLVSQLTEGDQRTNKAVIAFLSPDPKVASPHKPHEIALPDGSGTYGIVWDRGAGALWILQKDLVRKYEFANPAQVQEMKIEPGSILNIPAHMHDALKRAFEVTRGPMQTQMPAKPGDGADANPKAGAKLERTNLEGNWEGEKDGVKAEVQFQWLSEHQQVRWNLKTRNTGIGAQMSVVLEPDGSVAEFVFRKGLEFEATVGRLTPGEGGTMRLEIIPNPHPGATEYPAVKDLVLTRLPDADAENPKNGAKLDAGTEAQLDWGEAVSGLRGAVVIRGEPQGIYLAVQNVSPAPLRFTDTVKAKDLRKFYPSDAKGILFAFTSDEPTQTDVLLQPREVAYLRMIPPLKEGEHSPEAGLIEGIRKDALQTWAMVLQIATAPEGAWKGKLITADTRCALREGGPQPKNASAQALFKRWQNNARLNGDIPGGLVRLLHEKVKDFIRANEPDASGGPFAQKMKPLEPRFANAGDWKPADVVVLLDDIAAAHTIPLDNALTHLAERTLYPGTPLPASLEKADWGEPLPSGLRVAHLLEPRAGAYHLGTELKARILFHNTGSQHVEFITDTFQQPGHSAKRADGSELKLDATEWLTLGSMAAYRLAPGDYCEVHTPGLGIGAQRKDREAWEDVRAGSWILCAAGDEVVFTPGAAALSYHETPEKKGDWWLEFITERLNREAPVPTETKEREYLLYRVVRELFGTAPSTTEGDAFAADKSPDALKNLAALLAKHPYGKRSDGVIRAGSTKFRVLPPDADADKRPRVATGPGWYSLGDGVKFSVTRRPLTNTVVNEASIVYFQQGKENIVHKIALPPGHDTWATATMKGATELWVAEAGTLRNYNFTNPLQPVETRYEGGKLGDAPLSKELRGALDPVLSKPAAEAPNLKQSTPPPAAAPATEKPKGAAAKLTPDALLGTWRGTVNEENLMLSFHRPPVEKDVQCDIYFGEATIGVPAGFTIAEDGGSAEVVQHSAGGGMKFGTLIPVEAGRLKLELYGRQKGQQEVMLTRDAKAAATEPRQAEARELLAMWKAAAYGNEAIPGGFLWNLVTEARAYAEANPNGSGNWLTDGPTRG